MLLLFLWLIVPVFLLYLFTSFCLFLMSLSCISVSASFPPMAMSNTQRTDQCNLILVVPTPSKYRLPSICRKCVYTEFLVFLSAFFGFLNWNQNLFTPGCWLARCQLFPDVILFSTLAWNRFKSCSSPSFFLWLLHF